MNRSDPSGRFVTLMDAALVLAIAASLLALTSVYVGTTKNQAQANAHGTNSLWVATNLAQNARARLLAEEHGEFEELSSRHFDKALTVYSAMIVEVKSPGVGFGYTDRNVPEGFDAPCPPNDGQGIYLSSDFFRRPLRTQSFIMLHVLARWALYHVSGDCGPSSFDDHNTTVQRGRTSPRDAVRNANNYAWFAFVF